MFVALEKDTGKRVDITRCTSPREIKPCICQDCEEPVFPRWTLVRTRHFAHYPKTECSGRYNTEPETREHKEGKLLVATRLRMDYQEYTDAEIELEVVLKECGKNGRKADVLVIWPMGVRQAHEVQLASISIRELEERTNDYANAGIDVVWWLGKSANTESNRRWCLQTLGECYILEIPPETYGNVPA